MITISVILLVMVLGCLLEFPLVAGHGRMVVPAGRSSMWRYGCNNPTNYDDNSLDCGGYYHHWTTNGGNCGVCGDPWNTAPPRPNEAGGTYANGLIAKGYTEGQVIEVQVELTANHGGWFEFQLCVVNDPLIAATSGCLSLLKLAGSTETRYPLPSPQTGVFQVSLQLPADVTCSQCVLQWKYNGANYWGDCGDGTWARGCGKQLQYYACADIAIVGPSETPPAGCATAGAPPPPPPPPPGPGTNCYPTPTYAAVPGMLGWCQANCPAFCPATHCICV